ncbi:MAG: hypothetical protein H0T51_01760 [Pirellulales bacterium]|nr:hypothetical protein [Pirellulales bacterium]
MLHLAAITAPFYPRLAELGEFVEVQPEDMPQDYQTLLAHDDHMTVTVEAFHGSLVDVRVLQEHREGEVYTRSSLLKLQSNGHVVQLGIMRISMQGLSAAVRGEIESRATPLGRILIRHNVMRHVKLFRLWRILPGPELVRHLGVSASVGWDEVPPEASLDFAAGGTLSQPTDSLPVSEKPAYDATVSEKPAYGVGEFIYGRSAGIVVEGRPSVELLEIVRA